MSGLDDNDDVEEPDPADDLPLIVVPKEFAGGDPFDRFRQELASRPLGLAFPGTPLRVRAPHIIAASAQASDSVRNVCEEASIQSIFHAFQRHGILFDVVLAEVGFFSIPEADIPTPDFVRALIYEVAIIFIDNFSYYLGLDDDALVAAKSRCSGYSIISVMVIREIESLKKGGQSFSSSKILSHFVRLRKILVALRGKIPIEAHNVKLLEIVNDIQARRFLI